jgi:CheY-like chemotaxis protein
VLFLPQGPRETRHASPNWPPTKEPVFRDASSSPTLGPISMRSLGKPFAVLVVEDELLIRMDVAATIEEAGYKVYEAANADQAVELLELETIHVLFTDVDMPGSMDGVELAHYAHSFWPLKILITSGHRQVTLSELPPGAVFLQKPFRPAHVEKLRSMVA